MKLSIVSTMYYSEPYIEEFCQRVVAAASTITDDFEIILVNDGSPDAVMDKVQVLIDRGLPIRALDLTRNFGHHKAVLTGLRFARGEFVFLIDCDLEEQPEWLNEFWQVLKTDLKVDVVYGVQKERKGGWIEKHVNGLYYSLVNCLSDVTLPRNLLLVRLMRRNFVNSLLQFTESDVVFSALSELSGHKKKGIDVAKGHKSSTTYNFSRKLAMIMNSVVSHSARPLEFLFLFGTAIFLLSFLVLCVVIYLRLIRGEILEGWTSILLSIWLLGGLILMGLGVIGIYLARVFYQVKQRPLTLIKGDYFNPTRLKLRANEDSPSDLGEQQVTDMRKISAEYLKSKE